jgi:hypothetical protein
MNLMRAASIACAVVGTFGVMSVATRAKADWDDHDWHHHWHRPWGWGPPGYYYRPPPVYYAPPPVVYAPPPPPVYYSPGMSYGVTIR